MTEQKMTDEAAELLVTAILKQAILDYTRALSGNSVGHMDAITVKNEIEAWAKRDDLVHSGVDMPSVLAKLRHKYASFCAVAEARFDESPVVEFDCPLCGNTARIREYSFRCKNRKGETYKQIIRAARCTCGCEYRRNDGIFSKLH